MNIQTNMVKSMLSDYEISMTEEEFDALSKLIYSECGISLNPSKKIMLSSRLRKRMIELGFEQYNQYYDHLLSPEGKVREIDNMLDAVTTNKTEFFREPRQFKVLTKRVLPDLIKKIKKRNDRLINIWSAGCSSGEEPYTIAMVVTEFLLKEHIKKFSILATDICSQSLKKATDAIYEESEIARLAPAVRYKYLMRGTGEQLGYYRIVPELRKRVTCRRLNLSDSIYNLKHPMDIIFCRNVIIYFDRVFQRELFERFYQNLIPGGYIFIGSSETLQSINDKFKYIAPSIYRKPVHGEETIGSSTKPVQSEKHRTRGDGQSWG